MSALFDVHVDEITLTRPACGHELPYAHYVAADKIGIENSVFGKYHARLLKTQVIHHFRDFVTSHTGSNGSSNGTGSLPTPTPTPDGGGSGNGLIPPMTDTSIPAPFVATASDYNLVGSIWGYPADYNAPWRAFEQPQQLDIDSGWWSSFGSGTPSNPAWLKINLGEQAAITGYSITSALYGDNINVPTAWTLYGSNDANDTNDGGVWTEIDSQANVTDWKRPHLWYGDHTPETKTFAISPQSDCYQWYKIVVTNSVSSNGMSSDGVQIQGFQLLGAWCNGIISFRSSGLGYGDNSGSLDCVPISSIYVYASGENLYYIVYPSNATYQSVHLTKIGSVDSYGVQQVRVYVENGYCTSDVDYLTTVYVGFHGSVLGSVLGSGSGSNISMFTQPLKSDSDLSNCWLTFPVGTSGGNDVGYGTFVLRINDIVSEWSNASDDITLSNLPVTKTFYQDYWDVEWLNTMPNPGAWMGTFVVDIHDGKWLLTPVEGTVIDKNNTYSAQFMYMHMYQNEGFLTGSVVCVDNPIPAPDSEEKSFFLLNERPFFVHRNDELLWSFMYGTLCLEEYDFLNPQNCFQRVLLDVRSDSVIKEVGYVFYFPNDICPDGNYPDGFAVLYESNQGTLPSPPRVIEIGTADTYDGCVSEEPEDDELLFLQGKNVVTAQVRDWFDIDCSTSGVESPFDNLYHVIVQAPIGSFGVDTRVVSEHAVQVHRYFLNLC